MKLLLLVVEMALCFIANTGIRAMELDNNFDEEWSITSSGGMQPSCVAIPADMSLCSDIGYQNMSLPDLLNNRDLSDVVAESTAWIPLVKVGCHTDLQAFVCSLYSPVCHEKPIYPCRSLCENVRDGCLGIMRKFGYEWPEIFQCSKFPDSDPCIYGPSGNYTKTVNGRNCEVCNDTDTSEGIIHSSCQGDYVIRATVKKISTVSESGHDGDLELLLGKQKKFYKRSDSLPKKIYKQLLRRQVKVYISQAEGCNCENQVKPPERHLLGIRAEQMSYSTGKQATRFYVKFITPWNKNGRRKDGITGALKAIRRNNDICKE